MPIYAYQCAACGAEHEALQKISDPPLLECPACHQPRLVKKVTAAGFQLKGSGWYVTDFRDKGTAKKPSEAKVEGQKETGEGAAASQKEATPAGKSGDASASAPAATPAPSAAPSPGPTASPPTPGNT